MTLITNVTAHCTDETVPAGGPFANMSDEDLQRNIDKLSRALIPLREPGKIYYPCLTGICLQHLNRAANKGCLDTYFGFASSVRSRFRKDDDYCKRMNASFYKALCKDKREVRELLLDVSPEFSPEVYLKKNLSLLPSFLFDVPRGINTVFRLPLTHEVIANSPTLYFSEVISFASNALRCYLAFFDDPAFCDIYGDELRTLTTAYENKCWNSFFCKKALFKHGKLAVSIKWEFGNKLVSLLNVKPVNNPNLWGIIKILASYNSAVNREAYINGFARGDLFTVKNLKSLASLTALLILNGTIDVREHFPNLPNLSAFEIASRIYQSFDNSTSPLLPYMPQIMNITWDSLNNYLENTALAPITPEERATAKAIVFHQ
ncbi:hypothetical protein FACS1894113_1720 [Alphaproteobacteria bacterium]|nr:hypothetical protein FACS1894113_1720 [Alphaproteobacteria bacterium]